MKTYKITVNGKVYDVTVEETGGDATAPAPAPAAAPSPAPAPAASSAGAGSLQIKAAAAGKVVDIVAGPGTAVKRGDTVLILEMMKMETPVVAEQDGTIASVEVTKGQSVAAGEVLATMN